MNKKDEEAITALIRAIRDKGSHPQHHDEIMRKHRAEWPTLWRAIDTLVWRQQEVE